MKTLFAAANRPYAEEVLDLVADPAGAGGIVKLLVDVNAAPAETHIKCSGFIYSVGGGGPVPCRLNIGERVAVGKGRVVTGVVNQTP